MIKAVSELFFLLDDGQRKQFLLLQLLVIFMTLMEIVGIASVVPFMGVIADPSFVDKSVIMKDIYHFSGMDTHGDFTFFMGGVVLGMVLLSSALSILTTWKLYRFGSQVGMAFGSRLFEYYIFQPWLFHTESNSATLIKEVTQETGRITSQMITPLLQINAKAALLFLLLVSLFLLKPLVAVIGLVYFVFIYFGVYYVVRNRIRRNGETISETAERRFKVMNDGLGGIKEVLVMGKQSEFSHTFKYTSDRYAISHSANLALSNTPRYFVEALAIIGIVFLVLYLMQKSSGNLAELLPLLSVYALAGLKLLPAAQQIYANITMIRGTLPAFEHLRYELKASKAFCNESNLPETPEVRVEIPKETIGLKAVSLTYPQKSVAALDALSLDIPVNGVVGIVGASGAGKSTVIDILLGLIVPDEGGVYLDGRLLRKAEIKGWQQYIGYVPQHIFLLDGTIAENVAFTTDTEKVDRAKLKKAIALAHLEDLINELPEGANTMVGERGVQLSGGQRQRIGIARALYHDAQILIFDEATSALDGITEKRIMEAIESLVGKKTIIMIAHRIKTVMKCDRIYLLEKGRVADFGTYEALMAGNEHFRKMALHS